MSVIGFSSIFFFPSFLAVPMPLLHAFATVGMAL